MRAQTVHNTRLKRRVASNNTRGGTHWFVPPLRALRLLACSMLHAPCICDVCHFRLARHVCLRPGRADSRPIGFVLAYDEKLVATLCFNGFLWHGQNHESCELVATPYGPPTPPLRQPRRQSLWSPTSTPTAVWLVTWDRVHHPTGFPRTS